jgi:hypothetical protein
LLEMVKAKRRCGATFGDVPNPVTGDPPAPSSGPTQALTSQFHNDGTESSFEPPSDTIVVSRDTPSEPSPSSINVVEAPWHA